MATDRKIRCDWGRSDDLMQAYHDEEWGVPLLVDRLRPISQYPANVLRAHLCQSVFICG